MPNKLSQFWQELKRRKVIKTVAMYAATAFIIMEAADIMLPRLGLPDWTVTFLIILLIAGFPVAVIFSWIFDLTPAGMQRTESLQSVPESSPDQVKGKRRFKLSDFIIVALLVVVCMLLYPKVFNKDNLKDLRDDKGRISVAVMPFENLSGDSLLNIWQGGLQNLIISTLSNSDQLQVRQYRTVSDLLNQKATLNQASFAHSSTKEIVRSLDTRTYILGKILKAGNQIRVNAQLINSETEEVYKTYQIDGSGDEGFFTMADSLASMIRNYLEIEKLKQEYNTLVIQGSIFTHSAEAFKYYIRGWEAYGKLDFQSTQEWLMKAIETDSGFIEAEVFLSFSFITAGEYEQSKTWCDKAYNYREELPMKERLLVDHLHAFLYETPRDAIDLCKQILEIDEMNAIYWFLLGDAYYKLENYEEAVKSFEKALEIHEKWGTHFAIPVLFYSLGDSYHNLGDHKSENEVYALGLQISNENPSIIYRQLACALSTGNQVSADQYLDAFRAVASALNWSNSVTLSNIGNAYDRAHRIDEAEEYIRQALVLDPENPLRLNNLAWLLINENRNVDEGLALAEKALQQRPDDYNILDTWGWGLYKKGRYEEALLALKKSWDNKPLYSQTVFDHIEAVEQALSDR